MAENSTLPQHWHSHWQLNYLFIKIHQPEKKTHTVNAVKQAENRLVE